MAHYKSYIGMQRYSLYLGNNLRSAFTLLPYLGLIERDGGGTFYDAVKVQFFVKLFCFIFQSSILFKSLSQVKWDGRKMIVRKVVIIAY